MNNYSHNEIKRQSTIPLHIYRNGAVMKYLRKDMVSCRFNDLLSCCRMVVHICCFDYRKVQFNNDLPVCLSISVYQYATDDGLTCLGN